VGFSIEVERDDIAFEGGQIALDEIFGVAKGFATKKQFLGVVSVIGERVVVVE
jgi:hypothetical protein